LIQVPVKKSTLPHEVLGNFKSASVILRPATPGTGVIAGGHVRAIMDVCGIKDILSKSLGSKNSLNIVKAVFDGFSRLMDARAVARNRGKNLKDLWG
jgi:small subunit ribosomal protein S5